MPLAPPPGYRSSQIWRALALATCLVAAVPAAADPTGNGETDTGNQIRLNPPRGGDDGPSLPSFPAPSGPGPSAGPATMSDISLREAQRIFEDAGFVSVRLVQDEKGDYLRLSLGGRDSFVFAMNCTNGRCRSLMFMAFLAARRGASLNFVNDYNLKTLHTKMSKNAAGEIVLTMAASLTGGVTAQHLRSLGPFWDQVHRDALAWK